MISLETVRYPAYLNLIGDDRSKGQTDLLIFLDNWKKKREKSKTVEIYKALDFSSV